MRLLTIERVIVVRLQGRLGNQMFEYAIGRSLAERLETELVLDSTAIVQGARRGRRYELDCFDLGAKVCPVGKVARLRNASRLAPAGSGGQLPGVRSRRAGSARRLVLVGYWQFEEYFIEHEALIREASVSRPSRPRVGGSRTRSGRRRRHRCTCVAATTSSTSSWGGSTPTTTAAESTRSRHRPVTPEWSCSRTTLRGARRTSLSRTR